MIKELKFNKVTFGYKKNTFVLDNLSFIINYPKSEGYIVGLMGTSGSGKSTILKLILGIEKCNKGNINIFPNEQLISYVPQEPVLFEHLSIMDNAKYLNLVNKYKHRFNIDLFNKIARTLQIDNLLKSKKSINEISGGQKQRISLLRALSIQPDILLLDEPLTGLDEEVKEHFLFTLSSLIRELKIMVIYVSHHRKEIEFISDEILYLQDSNNIFKTTPNNFFKSPPTIASLFATKETSTNILDVSIDDNRIIPKTQNKSYKISFNEETIHFSNSFGFKFNVKYKTGIYIILYLPEFDVMLKINYNYYSLYNNNNNNNIFIYLSGNINIYSDIGVFKYRKKIIKNSIEL